LLLKNIIGFDIVLCSLYCVYYFPCERISNKKEMTKTQNDTIMTINDYVKMMVSSFFPI
jgi:hypothetical protein